MQNGQHLDAESDVVKMRVRGSEKVVDTRKQTQAYQAEKHSAVAQLSARRRLHSFIFGQDVQHWGQDSVSIKRAAQKQDSGRNMNETDNYM